MRLIVILFLLNRFSQSACGHPNAVLIQVDSVLTHHIPVLLTSPLRYVSALNHGQLHLMFRICEADNSPHFLEDHFVVYQVAVFLGL